MNKKSSILWFRILGAAFGCSGFVAMAAGSGQLNSVISAALIGVGTILIAAGS